ncbi:MAG: RDD family protein [Halieaceae bacterium]|nr:RDD family protein [Halieaceae bacterium]
MDDPDTVATPAAPRYMGFWARVLASVIDSVLIVVVLLPIVFLLYGEQLLETGGQLDTGANLLFNQVLPTCAIIAFWLLKSATPGKLMLGGVIVDADTLAKPALWQWLVRYAGYFISTLLLFLGFLWVAWDPRKQGFHDKLARTVVIYRNPGGGSD